MAVKIVSMALDSPYKPTPKLVLVVLGDFANDQGVCFPSRRTLKNKASIGKTTLNYILDAFEYIDLLKRKKQKRPNGSDTSSLYFIQVEKLFTLSNIENAIHRKYQRDEHLTDEEKKELNKKIDREIGAEKNKYLNEYLHAYNEVRKSKGRSQGDLPQKVSKNSHVTTRGHGGDHLEPSYNHQEDINISSLSKRALKSKDSFINYIRANFINKLIVETVDQWTQKPIAISTSNQGHLYNLRTSEDFKGPRARELWANLYDLALNGKLSCLQEEKTV